MRSAASRTSTQWPRPNRALRHNLSVAARIQLAKEAATFLRMQGAHSVWLFGSLAKGRPQDWRSDLDLAVAGLPPERYLAALGELLLRLPLGLDLIEMERASAPLRDQILTTGLLLHAD